MKTMEVLGHIRYRKDKLIGTGGFSEVWEGIDLQTGGKVAIKEMLRSPFTGP
jgi:serine/threonine protein kinase